MCSPCVINIKIVLWPNKFGKCCLSNRGSLQRRSIDTVRADTQMLRVTGLASASIPAKPGARSWLSEIQSSSGDPPSLWVFTLSQIVTVQQEAFLLDFCASYAEQWPPQCPRLVPFEAAEMVMIGAQWHKSSWLCWKNFWESFPPVDIAPSHP